MLPCCRLNRKLLTLLARLGLDDASWGPNERICSHCYSLLFSGGTSSPILFFFDFFQLLPVNLNSHESILIAENLFILLKLLKNLFLSPRFYVIIINSNKTFASVPLKPGYFPSYFSETFILHLQYQAKLGNHNFYHIFIACIRFFISQQQQKKFNKRYLAAGEHFVYVKMGSYLYFRQVPWHGWAAKPAGNTKWVGRRSL